MLRSLTMIQTHRPSRRCTDPPPPFLPGRLINLCSRYTAECVVDRGSKSTHEVVLLLLQDGQGKCMILGGVDLANN